MKTEYNNGPGGEFTKLTLQESIELDIIKGAFQTFRGNRREGLSYVGMPITSGKRYYDELIKNKVTSASVLMSKLGKSALYELVILPNIQEGITLADRLGFEHTNKMFIAPSVFEAKALKWSQEAYMSLWYEVIGDLVGSHYVMDGWEYSTGGVKEICFSLLLQWKWFRQYNLANAYKNFGLSTFNLNVENKTDDYWIKLQQMSTIKIYNSNSIELRIDSILELLVDAISWLKLHGFDYSVQLSLAFDIKRLAVIRHAYGPYESLSSHYFDQCSRLEKIAA